MKISIYESAKLSMGRLFPPVLVLSIASVLIPGCLLENVTSPEREGDVVVSSSTDKLVYSLGEEIRMTLTVHNRCEAPVTLVFNDGQIYDFVVRKMPAGTEVWRWSEGKAFTEAVWSMTLMPGERKSYSEVWDQRNSDSAAIGPGTYQVSANLSCEPEIFADPAQIMIEDRISIKQEFETIDKGVFSGYNTRSSLIIRDREGWKQTWNTHTRNILPPPSLPEIDFSTWMVIAVFRGEFPSSGYSTEITEVIKSKDRMNVTVVETDDTEGALLTVLTQPYHIIKLPKSELPVEFTYKRIIK